MFIKIRNVAAVVQKACAHFAVNIDGLGIWKQGIKSGIPIAKIGCRCVLVVSY
jgi:hypothetical protein